MIERINEMYEKKDRSRWRQYAWAIFIVAVIIWSSTTVNQVSMTKNGSTIASNILKGILTPDTSLLFNLTTQSVPYLLLETIAIAFLGTLVGAVISLPIAFLASKKIMPAPVVLIVRLFVVAVRTIPSFVYGLMFIRVTGPGAFAGLMTLSVTSIGMLTKLFNETIDDIDVSILEAMEAAGCNTFEKIRCGILPQLGSSLLSTLIFRFDMNLRDATTLGLVGAGGIGAPLIFAMSSYRWNQVGSILIGLIVLIIFVEFSSSYIRKRLARG
ncbi:phosphonate ABC transporter, permease protein PhnE [Tuanshanicoccus lijuaniae]|uniref:phosphonate ABC transporter, permease protein PhnE n=1 Tax=Aerococcaceae bacterium zg-1292 TaxID=2774330 RepID=UPI0019370D49|nr:phosphonate ABC transporter, permease protein PhnE [Aerococcaceae bacterium zg-1292]MBF6626118.1 phosphonate ABC transporter, permease protein PhnE [Aerococcaceae bacterium zg-BR9]MBS4455227.1 phosphonate ABC transporter, permease protein PhnE [Aerococcaceae bacterium zg-A91]MBS4457963.1 phosphonate ABC transporter, permease protein PhnE [Aerococcaceae bacterium zg-BR33]QQA36719.1 phosphonate ABC transporter, permease protein PhnE [Aerococcaceae bacterium zg-1292]